MMLTRILVPVDFSPCSEAALDLALTMADGCGAEVEVLHVWTPDERDPHAIFADTKEGVAFERCLTAAERHAARVSGRLEVGDEPSRVILEILARETFDLLVLGDRPCGATSEVAARIAEGAPCRVVRLRPR